MKERLAELEWKMDLVYEHSLSHIMRERAREMLHGTDRMSSLVPHSFYREALPGVFAAFDAGLNSNFFLYGGFELFQLSNRSTLSHLTSISSSLLGVAYDSDVPENVSVDLASLVLPPQSLAHSARYNSFVVVGMPKKGGWPSWVSLKKMLSTYNQWDSFYERVQQLASSDKQQYAGLQNVFLTLAQLELQLILLTSVNNSNTHHNRDTNSTAEGGSGTHNTNSNHNAYINKKQRRGGSNWRNNKRGEENDNERSTDLKKDNTNPVATIGAVIITDHSVAEYPPEALTIILDSPLGTALPLLSAVNAKGRLVFFQGRTQASLS